MQIGIDFTAALEQGGGIGRYVRELVYALARLDDETGYLLFAAGQTDATVPAPPGENFTWAPSRLTPRDYARLWHRLRLPMPVEWWTGRLDLFHATDFTLPPVQRGTRTLLTVHDLSFVRAPETAVPSLKAYLDRVVPRSVARADHILSDSEATRQDLIELYNTPPSKISVLYSGVDPTFAPASPAEMAAVRVRYNIGDAPFILSIGTVQPRKNYERLIEAFHRLQIPGLKLVIAGGKGWLDSGVYARVTDLSLQDRVHFLGFAADEALPALYSAASVFAFPSLYEGFGLPVIEAMACGTPVVCSNTSSVPEVAGDAALLIDPFDIDGLSVALRRVLEDTALRRDLTDRGRVQAARFTWDTAASELLTQYRRLLA